VPSSGETDLTCDEWERLITRLREIGVFHLLFSGGEILTYRGGVEVVRFAREQKFQKIEFTTNGTLIDRAAAGRLKECRLTKLLVSVDGLPETHDRIRGRGAFHRTWSGLRLLVDEGLQPQVKLTAMRLNYRDVGPLAGWLDKIGIRDFYVGAIEPFGRAQPRYRELQLSDEQMRSLRASIGEARKQARNIQIHPPAKRYYDTYPQKSRHQSTWVPKLKSCTAAHSSCVITSSGWVLPCAGFPQHRAGNVRENDILEIWRNAPELAYIRRLSEMTMCDSPYCRECPYTTFCDGGCRAEAWAVFGDVLAPDPYCPYARVSESVRPLTHIQPAAPAVLPSPPGVTS
jgi:radical SAM protein with 4Fe4S-binding SPASM domain